jgi:hypothetical protein
LPEIPGIDGTFIPAAIVVQNGQTILFAYKSLAESLTLVGEN